MRASPPFQAPLLQAPLLQAPLLQALFFRVITASPSHAASLAASAAAFLALAAALMAPVAGLLVMAALAAAALIAAPQGATWRVDRLAWAGLALTALAGAAGGVAGAMGAVFCWFLADSARAALRRSAQTAGTLAVSWSDRLPIPLGTLCAVLLVAAAAPHVVLGLPLDLPHPPQSLIFAVGIAYAIAAADWLVRVLARWRLGEGRPGQILADLSYHAVLLAGFALCQDVSAGLAGLIAYRLALAASGLAGAAGVQRA